jgi:hypothetical protein
VIDLHPNLICGPDCDQCSRIRILDVVTAEKFASLRTLVLDNK